MVALTLPERRFGIRKSISSLHWTLVCLLALIALVGVATLYSVAEGSWTPWAGRHAIRFALALVAMTVVGITPLRVWLQLSYPAYFFALGLLFLVPFIGEVNMGARRWIDFGPITVQPSEIMKIALVMALARYYHGLEFKRVSNPIYFTIPIFMVMLPVALVFQQPDLGTALLLLATGFCIILLAGLSWKVTILGAIAGAIGAITAIQSGFLKEYQIKRLTAFMDPAADPLGSGYHLQQSKIALGSGGVVGKGYMEGTQSQLKFLPEMHTDFIFTIFGEDFGLIGAVGLLALYLMVFIVGMNIAMRARSHFGRLLTMGISMTFVMYVLINTGMVMGLAPVVGVPLPLVSNGGTVMFAVMIAFGLVQATWICRDQDTLRTTTGLN